MKAPAPKDEAERLEALRAYGVLDTPDEPIFDDLTGLAAHICGTPTALLTLVDEQRQWFKSRHGFVARETPRDLAFCAHTILQHKILEVPDATRDPTFADNPLVTRAPFIRFYAGAPLVAQGHCLGTLAVLDYSPRTLTSGQRDALAAMARHAVAVLELRREVARAGHRARFAGTALQRAHERLQVAVRAAGVGLWDWNLRTGQIEVSAEAKRQIGYRDDEIDSSRDHWRERVHPEDLARLLPAVTAYLAGPASTLFSSELRLRHRDGSWRWVLVQADVVRDDGGKPVRLLGGQVDITAQKQTERALRLSDERHRFITRATNDAVWDWDLTTNLVWWNEAFQSLFGYRRDEIEPDASSWISRLHPDDAARVQTGIDAVIRSGAGILWQDEYRFRRADGSYAHVFDRGTVMRDADGTPLRMIGAMQDVTERVRATTALRASEERFRALMEGAADLVVVLGADGKVTYINPAIRAAGGYEPEEIAGRSMLEFLHPDDVKPARDLIASGLKEPARVGRAVWRLRHRDGSWRVFESLGRNLLGVPAVAGFVLNLRDVTQRQQADAALREQERRLSALLENLPGVTYRSRNDRDWTSLFISSSVRDLTGHGADEFLSGKVHFNDVMHPDDREPVWQAVQASLAQRRRWQCEYRIRTASGEERWVWEQGTGVYDARGEVESIEGFLLDITERRRQQERIDRLSRVRSLLSAVNALILRTRDRTQLLQELCTIAVEHGRFRLSWVALLHGDEAVPVAFAGDDQGLGLLERLRFSVRPDGPGGQGYTARALREGRPVVGQDLLNDPAVEVWRATSRRLGLRAFMAQPLFVGGRVVGCLGLYSAEPGFFDAEECQVLGELAANLSYALEFITRGEEMDYLTLYDPLTRLSNRDHFVARLDAPLRQASEAGRGAALLQVDIDGFKAYNELLGRAGGDELLRAFSDRLKVFAGGAAQVARIGGDRFAVLLPEVGDRAAVSAQLRSEEWTRLTRPFQIGAHELRLLVRTGVALHPDDAQGAENLLRNAEEALKHAKRAGDAVAFYSREMGAALASRLTLEQNLRRALERRELDVHYQPRIDLRTGAVVGAEALMRWGHHPTAMFIPVLESSGLIVDAGHWVLERVAADRRAWLARGVPAVRIAVNVSQVQLRRPDFVQQVRDALGADVGEFDLEVTESSLIDDLAAGVDKLVQLRALGMRIALDDFGTGYSSLSHLARLPVHSIKIDRSFVAGLADGDGALAIVTAIVSLGRSLGVTVVAEGVEAPAQVERLRGLGCDELQGFVFSRPVAADAFAALLLKGPGQAS